MTMIDNHINTLYEKYSILIDALLTLDEWMFFTTSIRFFETPEMRIVFKRYSLMVSTCKEEMSIEFCAPLCREFNLNKFSFLWDGEIDPFNNYVENFKKFQDKYKDELIANSV